MNKNDQDVIQILDACAKRREDRRAFIRASGGAVAAVAGASVLSACSDDNNISRPDPVSPAPTPAPSPTPSPTPAPGPTATDRDVLNFALNLEYLEAQFYYYASFGEGLPSSILGGTGTRGNVIGGRRVDFRDPQVALYAREIAQDERAHVEFLRTALGSAAVAQPTLNISGDANGAFTAAARAAGVVGANGTFDPYASDENFLLGAFIFEDVGVTAYKGASPLIDSKVFLEAAAGILAAEAYHAGLIRTTLFAKGVEQMQSLITATEQISDARDSLDDPSDKDQGIAIRNNASNLVPTDNNGIAFSRSVGDVLNIVYLTRAAATQGGFFPNGVNGTLRASSPFS